MKRCFRGISCWAAPGPFLLILLLVSICGSVTLPCSSGTVLISTPGSYLIQNCGTSTMIVNINSNSVGLVMLNVTFGTMGFLSSVTNISLTLQDCRTSAPRISTAPTIIDFVGDVANSSIALFRHSSTGGSHFIGCNTGTASNSTILVQDSRIINTVGAVVYFGSASSLMKLLLINCIMSFVQSDAGNWIRFDAGSRLEVSVLSTTSQGNGGDCFTSVGATFARVSILVYNSSIQCFGVFVNALTLVLSSVQVLSSTIDTQQGVVASNNNNAVTLHVDQSVFRLRGPFATANNLLNRISLIVSCSNISQTVGDVVVYDVVDSSTIVFSGSTVTTSSGSSLVSASVSMLNSSIVVVRTAIFSTALLVSIPGVFSNNNFTSLCTSWWGSPITKTKNVAARFSVVVLSKACGRLRYRCASYSTTATYTLSGEAGSSSASSTRSDSPSKTSSKSVTWSTSKATDSASRSSLSFSFQPSDSLSTTNTISPASPTASPRTSSPSPSESPSKSLLASPSHSLPSVTRTQSSSDTRTQSATLSMKRDTLSAAITLSPSISWATPLLVPISDTLLSGGGSEQEVRVALIHGTFSPVASSSQGIFCIQVESVTPPNATITAYLAQSALLNVTSPVTATIEFPGTSVFRETNSSTTLVVLVIRLMCIRGPKAANNFSVVFEIPASPPAQALTQTQRTLSTTAVAVATLSANAGVAIQADRSTLAFSIQYCRPQQGELDFMDSPIPLALGSNDAKYYAGGMIMNLCIVAGFSLMVIAASLAASFWAGGSIISGMTKLRCPSVISVPLMILLQPSVTCAMVATVRPGGDVIFQGLGIGVLCLCVLVPTLYGWFIHDEFSAQAVEYALARAPPSLLRTAKIFLFGTTKWQDSVFGSGFAQRHRLFFVDYRQNRHWFIVVEMVMCIACGGMEGLKLGEGRCGPVLIALVVVTVVYLILVTLVRPFDAHYSNAHTILLCTMQCISAVCVLLNQLYGFTTADTVAQWSTILSLYLVMGRAAVDLLPLARRIYMDCMVDEEPHRKADIGLEHREDAGDVMLVNLWNDDIDPKDVAGMDEAVSTMLREHEAELSEMELQEIRALHVRLYLPGCEAEAFGELAAILSSMTAFDATAHASVAKHYVPKTELHLRAIE